MYFILIQATVSCERETIRTTEMKTAVWRVQHCNG